MINPVFYNSDYIVVEYLDLIKSPYLVLLDVIRSNPRILPLINILELDSLISSNREGLNEWYINRKHQNFLEDLIRNPKITKKILDDLLDDQISSSDKFYEFCEFLPLTGSLKIIKAQKLVKDIIIYYPHDPKYAREDLKKHIKEDFVWMSDWDEVMKRCKANSTYFLSDINKISRMKDAGVLEFSSIILADEYRYNKKNMYEFNLDFDALSKEQVFKLSYLKACRYKEDI